LKNKLIEKYAREYEEDSSKIAAAGLGKQPTK